MKKVLSFELYSYDIKKIEEFVEESFTTFEIFEKFQDKKKIILKPNLLTKPNSSVNVITTNPIVVEGVLKVLLKNKIPAERVCIADGSSAIHKQMDSIFSQTGYLQLSKSYGVELINLNQTEYFIKNRIKLSKILIDSPHIINIAKLKTHMLTKLTLSIKNLYGLIPGEHKLYYHTKYPDEESFCDFLTKLYKTIEPDLNILDGIEGMQGNGPGGGELAQTGLLVASDDGFSLDHFIATLSGLNPDDLLFLKKAKFYKYFDEKYEIYGSSHRLNLKMPDRNNFKLSLNVAGKKFLKSFIVNYPKVDEEKCEKCFKCYNSRPSGAIVIKDGFPNIKERKCITYYCCIEVCQFKAIKTKKSLFEKFYENFL